MAAPGPMFTTIIHLATGHVLAAVSSGGLEPTLEELTAADHVRVRFPGGPGFVNVPSSALTAIRVGASADVLDRSQHYIVGTGNPPLTLGEAPVFNVTVLSDVKDKHAVVVWQAGGDSIVASGPLGANGEPPGTRPPGATHWLLAFEGAPLHLNDDSGGGE
jgi:hypothetical protein